MWCVVCINVVEPRSANTLRLACVWSEEPICHWQKVCSPTINAVDCYNHLRCNHFPPITSFLHSSPQYPSGSLPWRLKMTPWRTSVKSPSAIWVVPIFKTSQYKYPWSIFSQLSTVSTIGLSSMPYLWTKHGTGHNYLGKAMVIY